MKILISNDDGVESQGIILLAKGLAKVGDVTVVAPHRERSTSGHSLTLHKPVRCKEISENFYAVTGTPADCVYMATRHIMKSKPDIIVSGINRGANLGNDTFYSGTVAAAREGAYFGIPAVAFSLCFNLEHQDHDNIHWNTAVEYAKLFVPKVFNSKFKPDHVLNVNVPNVEPSKVKGVKIAKQGLRIYDDTITKNVDPRGRPYYWIGGKYKGFDNIPGSDCVAVDQHYISITPLSLDVTHYKLMEELKSWAVQFEK